MRKLACLLFLGIGLTVHSQTETYLSVDFKKGIPSDFVLKDFNENLLVPTDYKAGRVNQTWSMFAVDSEDIKAALSTSRGERDIDADKWMITPQVKIASDNAWLSWDAKSIHYDLRDGYKVMISTTGQSPENFKEVFSIKEEDYFWAHHFISLKEYQGKDIYVAFVNNSYNKYILAVTNLFIGVPAPGEFEVIDETPRFVGDISTAAVKGKIRNLGGAVNMSELACVSKDGQVLKQTYDNRTLEPGETADYEFALPVSVGSASGYTLKVSTDAHTEKEVLKDSVVCSTFPMTLVAEERTGTWCNSCPRGTLYMALLKKRYKDQIITIVAHNGDPMAFEKYDKLMGRWIFDLPGFIYNRSGSTGVYYPSGNYKFEDDKLAKVILKPVEAKVDMEVNFDNQPASNVVSTKAKVLFANNLDNSTDQYRLGYAVVEKWVNGYKQQNALSLAIAKEYNFLPVTIPERLMFFHDVPRGNDSAVEGIANSLPETIEPNTEYDFDYQVEIPETVGNMNNISVIVFVLDTKTRNIMNASEVVNPNLGASAIQETNSSNLLTPVIYQSPGKQTIQIQFPAGVNSESVHIQLTGLDGRSVFSAIENTGSTLSVPTNGLKGCYIINMVINNQVISQKIMLN